MRWLNQNIFVLGFASLFSDLSHEMVTAVLPYFIISLGGTPATLGIIEGLADGSVSFIKLISGWVSDWLGKRKAFAVIGYFFAAIGIGTYSFALRPIQVLIGRVLARVGKGVRDPARDALIVESTTSSFHARVFGFHRAMDTIGAIIGPLIAYFLLIQHTALRTILMIAFIPSLLPSLLIFFLVKEQKVVPIERFLFKSLQEFSTQFKQLLLAAGMFSFGKFAVSLLILRASNLLIVAPGISAMAWGILFYVIHNIFYAGFSYPVGFFADRFGKKRFLLAGYLLAGVVALGAALAYPSLLLLTLIFIGSGISYAITDGLTRGLAADFLPEHMHGTGFGTLSMIEGVGSLFASSVVGLLWTYYSPFAGFFAASIFCFLGFLLLIRLR